jgi:hypothetical protein
MGTVLPVSVWGIDRNAEHTTGEQETDRTNRVSDLGDRISDRSVLASASSESTELG